MKNSQSLKDLIDHKIQEEDENVSSIYIEFIQPFCASGGNCEDLIIPNDALIEFPPGILKIRRYFLQIFLLLDIFHSKNKPDPIPNENMKELLFLIRSIAPLAPLISESMLFDMFEELNSIFDEIYPETISYLMKSIGINENDENDEEDDDDLLGECAENPHRVHYEDGEAILTGLEYQPNKTILQNYPLFQSPSSKDKSQIKRPKHGPGANMKSTH